MTGFDAAQASFDAAVPAHLEDGGDVVLEGELGGDEWCLRCGDQAVCPECVGT